MRPDQALHFFRDSLTRSPDEIPYGRLSNTSGGMRLSRKRKYHYVDSIESLPIYPPFPCTTRCVGPMRHLATPLVREELYTSGTGLIDHVYDSFPDYSRGESTGGSLPYGSWTTQRNVQSRTTSMWPHHREPPFCALSVQNGVRALPSWFPRRVVSAEQPIELVSSTSASSIFVHERTHLLDCVIDWRGSPITRAASQPLLQPSDLYLPLPPMLRPSIHLPSYWCDLGIPNNGQPLHVARSSTNNLVSERSSLFRVSRVNYPGSSTRPSFFVAVPNEASFATSSRSFRGSRMSPRSRRNRRHQLVNVHQHSDMQLDVDSMPYEELLTLEERIGSISSGLSEEAMSACMKTNKHASNKEVASEDKEIKCSICQEEYNNGDETGILNCNHSYHMACIKQWLALKNQCPICKATPYTEP